VHLVLDARVGAREEEALVAVRPSDAVRRGAVLTPNFQDLGVALGVPDVMALDDQPITDLCVHHRPPRVRSTGSVPTSIDHEDVDG
jgi:hypothetical protein